MFRVPGIHSVAGWKCFKQFCFPTVRPVPCEESTAHCPCLTDKNQARGDGVSITYWKPCRCFLRDPAFRPWESGCIVSCAPLKFLAETCLPLCPPPSSVSCSVVCLGAQPACLRNEDEWPSPLQWRTEHILQDFFLKQELRTPNTESFILLTTKQSSSIHNCSSCVALRLKRKISEPSMAQNLSLGGGKAKIVSGVFEETAD